MAGSGEKYRDLDATPTWTVALVCAVMIIISLLLEKALHHMGEWFKKKNKHALAEALEKLEAELMILGFISLLLVFSQKYIAKICIPKSAGNIMFPCRHNPDNDKKIGYCSKGKVPFMSEYSLHAVHLFIFFLACVHVVYTATVMALGRLKIRSWKEWEKETMSLNYEFSTDPSRFRFAHQTSFVQQNASFGNRATILLYIVSFFRQFIRSVRRIDYLTLRHGFIHAHLNPGMKFNFQKYIKRSLDDDFKEIVGINPTLWACGCIILLLNIYNFQKLFWVTLLPLVLILAVGTKLQAIIAKMAIEIQHRHTVIQGMPVVKLSDHHFWFGRPHLVLSLIHFSLFVNAFQLTHFLWIWYKFGINSCFHDNFGYVIARLLIGITVHLLCSYITLPLYALVSQMGSHIKMSIFDENTSKALKKWRDNAKKRHKLGSTHSPSITPSSTPGQSPMTSPRSRHLYQNRPFGYAGDGVRRAHSETDIPDAEIEMPVTESGVSQYNAQHEVRLNVEERRRDSTDEDGFSFAKPGSRKG
ncbi:MLO-like protein [Rhynchospora pubera]|uniref:MLO-like protein n=1 Tax=Rhynchospora pubera TaxID=906938 RepID=A0AAV8FZY5_9POAL|nr:MLO-like protein [Rhynchospora pubera]